MKKGQKVLGAILLTAAVLGLAGILFLTFGAVKDLSVSYHAMQEADLTEEYTGTLIYDDHLYAMIGNGIEIDETVTDRAGMMGAFLEDALRTIDMRILSAGIIYAMMISAVAAYPLMCRYGEKRGAHVGAACCSVVVCYFIYLASVLILCRAFGVPFRLPALSGLLRLAAGLLCTMGGSCALAVLISSVRFGAVAAVLAVPLVFALFLFSMLFEAQLYGEPTIDSFAYL